MMIFSALIPLIVLGLLGWLLVSLFRRAGRREVHDSNPAAPLKGLFVYGLMLAALFFATAGASSLLHWLIGTGDVVVDRSNEQLARALSFLVVGVPAYWILFRVTRRRSDVPDDVGGWSVYMVIALTVSLIVAMTGGFGSLQTMLGDQTFDREALARLLIWAAVWAAHWFVLRPRYEITGDVHLALGSLAGLVATFVALGALVGTVAQRGYEELFRSSLVQGGLLDALAAPIAGLVVGVPVWWLHWLRRYTAAARTLLWHSYVVLAGILSGVLTVAGGVATAIFATLVWYVGDPDAADAALHFDVIPGAVTALVIGAALWWHHRMVLYATGTPERTEPLRVYDYVIAGAGLVAAAAGSAIVVIAIVEAATPSAVTGSDAANSVVAAVTMLGMGLPVWWVAWRRITRWVQRQAEAETLAPSRRMYLLGTFGVAAAVAFGSLLTLVYIAFQSLLDGTFGSETMRDLRVPLALIVSVGAVAWFHHGVWRRDRSVAMALPAAGRQKDVLMVTADPRLVAALAERTGARVRAWTRLDGTPEESIDIEAAAEAVLISEHQRLLVVAGDDGVVVVPFDTAPPRRARSADEASHPMTTGV